MIKEDPKLTCLLHKMNLDELEVWKKLTQKIVKQLKKMEIPDKYICEIEKQHEDAYDYKGIGKHYFKEDNKEYFYYEPVRR